MSTRGEVRGQSSFSLVLAHGFARVRCEACKDELLVAFSCKGRGVCPSCNAKRAHVTAAHLVEKVLPRVPYRQWPLSFPHRVRWALLKDSEWLSDALTVSRQALRGLEERLQLARTGPSSSSASAHTHPYPHEWRWMGFRGAQPLRRLHAPTHHRASRGSFMARSHAIHHPGHAGRPNLLGWRRRPPSPPHAEESLSSTPGLIRELRRV